MPWTELVTRVPELLKQIQVCVCVCSCTRARRDKVHYARATTCATAVHQLPTANCFAHSIQLLSACLLVCLSVDTHTLTQLQFTHTHFLFLSFTPTYTHTKDDMLAAAKQRYSSCLEQVTTWDAFMTALNNKHMVLAPWADEVAVSVPLR